MNIVLLSGGSGTRLWPLSNGVRSKQFLKIFRDEKGVHESMVQRMYRMIKKVSSNANILIATSENQVSAIKNQPKQSISGLTEKQADVLIEQYQKQMQQAIQTPYILSGAQPMAGDLFSINA